MCLQENPKYLVIPNISTDPNGVLKLPQNLNLDKAVSSDLITSVDVKEIRLSITHIPKFLKYWSTPSRLNENKCM